MAKLIAIVTLQVASGASILGLYITLWPLSGQHQWWYWPLIVIVLLVTVFIILDDVAAHLKSSPKIYQTDRKINTFMCRWIASSGRVVIFSRDMSWAGEGAVRNILIKKACNKELIICLEHRIPLTDELLGLGAQIVTYGDCGFVP